MALGYPPLYMAITFIIDAVLIHSKRDSEAKDFGMPMIDLSQEVYQKGWVDNTEYHKAFQREPG